MNVSQLVEEQKGPSIHILESIALKILMQWIGAKPGTVSTICSTCGGQRQGITAEWKPLDVHPRDGRAGQRRVLYLEGTPKDSVESQPTKFVATLVKVHIIQLMSERCTHEARERRPQDAALMTNAKSRALDQS
eukprot:Gb_28085 [translate_table: standard]